MSKCFKKPFFRKLFLSYTAILLVCSLIFSAVLLQQIYQQDKSAQQQQSQSDARLLAQVADDKFTEIGSIGTQLASSRWIQKVRSQSEILNSSISVLERWDICQEMKSYYAIVQVSDSIALLLPEKRQAVDRISFWEEERYFSSVGLEGGLMGPELMGKLTDSYKSMMLSPGENGDFYVLKQLDYNTQPESVLFCLINGMRFRDYLAQRFSDSLGSFQISTGGETIFSMVQNEDSENQWVSFEIDSGLYQWTYSIAIKPGQTASSGHVLMMAALLVVIILAGVGLALLLARASYAPLFQMMQRLNLIMAQENEPEFLALEQVFQNLNRQNKDLEQISAQYYNTMRINLISSLLSGSFSQEQATRQLPMFGLEFQEDMEYLVGVLEYVDTVSPSQKAMDYMQLNTFCQEEGISAQWIETIDQQLIGIFRSAHNRGELYGNANQVRDYCISRFGQDVDFTCGLPQKGLGGIGLSYQEARRHSLQSELEETYYYPLETELKLINQLKLGNKESSLTILKELREENKSRSLSRQDSERVPLLIMETLLRVATDLKLEQPSAREEFGQILASENWEWVWDYLHGTVEMICSELQDRSESSSLKIGPKLMAYVQENYSDSSLSQQQLSSVFNISRSMVSKIFKNTAKVNFIDYLHLLRIQKAKSYFDGGERDVLAVAKMTGYENETTFKRAFLRVEAVTPRKYVQQVNRK